MSNMKKVYETLQTDLKRILFDAIEENTDQIVDAVIDCLAAQEDPEQVYSPEILSSWATDNGFVFEETDEDE